MDNAINKAEQAKQEKINKERNDISTYLDGYMDSIVGQINADAVPSIKITDYGIRDWMKKAIDYVAPHQDLWHDFVEFFEKEELNVILREDHDGQGIRDWSVLTVRPKQGLKNASKS
jgi:hypothetical protein